MSVEKEEKMSQGGQVSKLQMQKNSVRFNKFVLEIAVFAKLQQ